MKGKEDGTSRSEPRREPSPFFVSLRVLRALAGGIIVIAVLGLTFSLLPSFSGIPEIPSAGRVLEGTAGLRDGPRWLPEHGDPHALGELSHRLALDLADRPLPELSGGQRQRIALARALYKDFELLVMDEATAALDMETEMAVIDSIRQIKENKTLIMVTHHMSLANECDAVYKIEDRKILRVK